MSAALEAARSYVARGWNPLPLPFKSKIPQGEGWQKRVIREPDLPRYFNGHPQNVGVVLGLSSAGLTDLDLDCREAIAIAPYILPKTGAIFGRHSAPASHWLYYSSLSSRLDKATIQFRDPMKPPDEAMLLEIRVGGVKGAQTVFPGSVYESGEEIRWDENGDPATVTDDKLLKCARLLASACLFARYWPGDGARHDAALSLGGFLARAGLDQPQIKCMVEGASRAAGDEEWKDRVRAAEDAAQAFHAGKPARGYPLLVKTFGKQVAKQVAERMKYTGSTAPDAEDEFAVAPVDPIDIWAKFDPPTLPRGLLPKVIEEFAFDRGMTMGCDMSGIAVGALAVCAAAITDTIRIKPKKFDREWQESARLWVALIGPVSAMKSPMLKAVAKPLQAIDNVLARDYQREMAEYNRLPKEEKQQKEKPLQTRVMAQDVTIEATQDILQDSPAGILYYSDELSGWFGSMDKYSGARGSAKDRAFWLESYNGGSYTVDRVQRGTVFVEHLSVSMLGGIQPETICRIAGDSVDDGLLQRFIPVVTRPAVDSRDEPPSEVVFDYNALIRKLHQLKPPMTGGLMETVAPLTFDDGAMAIRKDLERKHLRLQQCESINRKLAAHIGKYNGIFARLCVVWHCVEHAGGDSLPAVVTADTARRVAGFLHGFLLPHALAFYAGVLGLSNDHDQLSDIASYILARKLVRITNRDVQRGSKGMRSLKQREVEGLFEQFDAFGWLTRVPGPRPSYPHHWVVNPAVHQKFAERAEAEKKRREQDRETLAALFGGKNA